MTLLRCGWRASKALIGARVLLVGAEEVVCTPGWSRSFGPSLRGFSASPPVTEKTDSLFVCEYGPAKGASPILIGMLSYLARTRDCGYFQAISSRPYAEQSLDDGSRHVQLMRNIFKLQDQPSTMVGMGADEAHMLLGRGKGEEVVDAVLDRFSQYKKGKEFTLVYGGRIQDLDLECKIANAMESPMVLLVSAPDMQSKSVMERVLVAMTHIKQHKTPLLGVIVSQFDPSLEANALAELQRQFQAHGVPYLGCVPRDAVLMSQRLDEIIKFTKSTPLTKSSLMHQYNDAAISRVVMATESVDNLLSILRMPEYYDPTNRAAAPLILTSGDRADVLLSLLAAHQSAVGPHVAGIVLGGRLKVSQHVLDIFNNTPNVTLPVVHSYTPLLRVSAAILKSPGEIHATSTTKIARSIELFNSSIDVELLDQAIQKPPERTYVPPKVFQHRIYSQCQANPQRIVLPESDDVRIVTAAAQIAERKLARVILLGKHDEIRATADRLKVKLDHPFVEVVDPTTSTALERYVAEMVEARKHKGMTAEMARDQLQNGMSYATMMVRCGDADGVVSGAAHTTADTVRPALQLLGGAGGSGKALVSSVFFMMLPDRVLVYGDCAVNPNPTAEELAAIARTSAATAQAFGIDPRVAMLSYSTLGSGSGPLVEKVEKATEILRASAPDLAVEGPIQYDAAVDPRVAQSKVKKESRVAGKANVLVFPDLNTGNNTYKAVQQSTGGIAMGPVLQGLAKPVNDLSRGCTVDDVVNTVCITAVQAMSAAGAGK